MRQYNYIYQHGGIEAFDRVVEYMATVDYAVNIFKAGAYLYQWLDEVQDFEACFRDFITPPEPSEADRSAA